MNVEGAAVEREIGRTIMPRFHAAFSLGTVAGAAVGRGRGPGRRGLRAPGVRRGAGGGRAARRRTARFLPAGAERRTGPRSGAARGGPGPSRAPWRSGCMVLSMALTEGVANDWLAVALVDGYAVPAWVGASGFALFVDRDDVGADGGHGAAGPVRPAPGAVGSMAVAGAGVLLVVFGQVLVVVAAGIVLWGLGASLGFPVGMSAAADEEDARRRAGQRGLHDRVHRLPRRPAGARLPRRPGRVCSRRCCSSRCCSCPRRSSCPPHGRRPPADPSRPWWAPRADTWTAKRVGLTAGVD